MLRLTVILLILGALGADLARADMDEVIVKRWLATNVGVDTLKIEFTQSRQLTSLKSVTRQNGVLWVDHRGEGRFRWQTGEPPQTIVIRRGGQLLIVRPRSKKYERRWTKESRSSMAMLAEGFPRRWEEFQRKYRLLGVKSQSKTHRIDVQPLGSAGRGVRVLTFVIGNGNGRLQGIDAMFRDGSSQQIAFDKVVTKVPLPTGLFSPDLTGYQETKF